jgi:hypothetical protein
VPTKRARKTPIRVGIPPRALEAWRIGDELGVIRALGLQPWQPSPFHVNDPEPPANMAGTMFASSWPHVWELRQALLEMSGPPGRVGRHGQPLGPQGG